MTGNGYIPHITQIEPQLVGPQNSLYNYLIFDSVVKQSNDWVNMQDVGKYFGPELSFAKSMELADRPIAVIKFASNGSSLHWRFNPNRNDLYPLMIGKINSSLSQLDEYNIRGFVWVQGEGDANDAYNAGQYDENLLGFANKIRLDLSVPDLPFYYNQAHTNLARPFTSTLRNSQYEASLHPNMYMINIDDLGLNPDSVHFGGITTIEVGRRFANLIYPSSDFNHDSSINTNDLDLWSSSFGVDRLGDSNSDGYTDGTDFLNWQRQLSVASIEIVPEPSSALLVIYGLSCYCYKRRLG